MVMLSLWGAQPWIGKTMNSKFTDETWLYMNSIFPIIATCRNEFLVPLELSLITNWTCWTGSGNFLTSSLNSLSTCHICQQPSSPSEMCHTTTDISTSMHQCHAYFYSSLGYYVTWSTNRRLLVHQLTALVKTAAPFVEPIWVAIQYHQPRIFALPTGSTIVFYTFTCSKGTCENGLQ